MRHAQGKTYIGIAERERKMDKDNKRFQNNTLENFLQCIPNKKLVLFGAGNEMTVCLDKIIDAYHLNVEYLVDNDFRKWYTNYYGYEVREPQYLAREGIDAVVVLITSMFPFRIEQQLIRMGIKYYFSSLLFLERHMGKQQFIVYF